MTKRTSSELSIKLIEETLALYDGSLKKVEFQKIFDSRIDEVKVDREQMQRVFINLIDNSLDALAESQVSRRIKYLAATITTNPVPLKDEAEYLIVLDDLTELIKAEKFSAWQEVAKRLAHEIKNPLTPIQLSAERVNKRFAKVVQNHASSEEILDFQRLLGEAMQIIATEADILRTLVEEFSRFARLPICKPRVVASLRA